MPRTIDSLELFESIVRHGYLGDPFDCFGRVYHLEPKLIRAYDFLRDYEKAGTEFERLMRDLNETVPQFKTTAKSEIYRSEGGWTRSMGKIGCIRKVKAEGEMYLLPILSRPVCAIDTSRIPNDDTFIGFFFLSDPEGAYLFLKNHLNLPLTSKRKELKWRRIDEDLREFFLERLELFISLFCDALLILKTNVLTNRLEKPSNIFVKLIDGCFSGYEHKKKDRLRLKDVFYNLANNKPTHCDADFTPLSPAKIVRFLVKRLAKKGKSSREAIPNYIVKKSHESKPLQVADTLVGAIRTYYQTKNNIDHLPFTPLPFDVRKIKQRREKELKRVKAYYWLSGAVCR